MYWKYLIKQINPWNTWTRIFLALCLPPAIYLQNVMLITILMVLLLLLALVFPVMRNKFEIEFLYHAMRGHFLELKGVIPHDSMVWRVLMGSIVMKIITSTIILVLILASLYLLWNGNLFWGSAIFYAIVALQLCLISEWSNLSKLTPSNQEWDDIYQSTIN